MSSIVARIAGLLAVASAVFALGSLLVTILERKREASEPFARVSPIGDETDDPAIWGATFPLQYELYRRTVDQVRTRHGGSEAIARTPTGADPRTVVAQSKLEADPRLRTIFAGHAFAVDLREERGHAYMLEDQTFTQRQQVAPQSGACLQCHASVYPAMKRLGEGDLGLGFERLNAMAWSDARREIAHPVSCIDCHDPQTLGLRITRPAFIEGMRAWKQSEGIADYDVSTMATHREMRSFVCAQCHVEYAFEGPGRRLVLPWSKGIRAEQILADSDARGLRDWVHAETGTALLKAQHPEFELWSQGTHARAGVACADCHMPYRREGAKKVSDHQVRSPLLDVNRSCQTCHPSSEAELQARVLEIQQRTFDLRERALDALVELIADLRVANETGLPAPVLARARDLHRKAQFLVDFVEAENSMGFHAPQEAAVNMAFAVDYARQAQLVLAGADGGDAREPAESKP